jgi:hypothetical protein
VKSSIRLQKAAIQGEPDVPAWRFFEEVGFRDSPVFCQRNLRIWATTSCGALM